MSFSSQTNLLIECDCCDGTIFDDWLDYDPGTDYLDELADDHVEWSGGVLGVKVSGREYPHLCESCWEDTTEECANCDTGRYIWNDDGYWCDDFFWSSDHEECAQEWHREGLVEGWITTDEYNCCYNCGLELVPHHRVACADTHKQPRIRLKASV